MSSYRKADDGKRWGSWRSSASAPGAPLAALTILAVSLRSSFLPPSIYPLMFFSSHCHNMYEKTKRNDGGTAEIATGGQEKAGDDGGARSDSEQRCVGVADARKYRGRRNIAV